MKMYLPSPRSILFLCLLAAGLPVWTAAQSNDDEVVRIDSSLVVLNVLVSDKSGTAVSGLKAADFRVFEDGVEQELDLFESREAPYAAVILLDTSGSMEERVTLARSAAINFLGGLRPDDVAAIYNFDSKVSLVQDFSSSRDIAYRAYELKADGMTVLNDAVVEAAQALAGRPEKRKAIVLLSDGADTRSRRSESNALKSALAVDATIYAVDMSALNLGNRERLQNQNVLKNFAEKTGGRFIATPGGAALRTAFADIARELGEQYTLAYRPSNQSPDGKWRRIEVRVKRPDLKIRTRRGYEAAKAR